MRTEDEIRQRVRGLLTQELDRRVEEATRRLPHLCTHNHRQALDNRKTVNGEPNANYNRVTNGKSLPTIGLCMLGAEDTETWNGTICEDPIDAQRCPYFSSEKTKDVILDEFHQDLITPGWIDEHMPELAGLFWVLDQGYQVKLPWWKRLWFAVLRIRVEPVVALKDPVALLEPPAESSEPPNLPS